MSKLYTFFIGFTLVCFLSACGGDSNDDRTDSEIAAEIAEQAAVAANEEKNDAELAAMDAVVADTVEIAEAAVERAETASINAADDALEASNAAVEAAVVADSDSIVDSLAVVAAQDAATDAADAAKAAAKAWEEAKVSLTTFSTAELSVFEGTWSPNFCSPFAIEFDQIPNRSLLTTLTIEGTAYTLVSSSYDTTDCSGEERVGSIVTGTLFYGEDSAVVSPICNNVQEVDITPNNITLINYDENDDLDVQILRGYLGGGELRPKQYDIFCTSPDETLLYLGVSEDAATSSSEETRPTAINDKNFLTRYE